ncbi:MAG: protein-disulfide reductase DsbD N-terminal domain-containing protein [Gemmataceae bacterium]|nr:protein-disulfide reductase DsbD N-terminal domain-containing protein [Gemmataceae bacterium]
MKISLRLAVAAFLVLGALAVVSTSTAGARKSDSEVKIKAAATPVNASGKQEVLLTLDINKGWHLYANPVGNDDFESARTQVKIDSKSAPATVKIDYPKGNVHDVKMIGKMHVYQGKVEIRANVQRAQGDQGPLDVSVKFMACGDENGQCLLPATVKLQVK